MDSLKRVVEQCRKYAAEYRAGADETEDELAELRDGIYETANEWGAVADRIESLMSQGAVGEASAPGWFDADKTYATDTTAPQDCEEVRRELESMKLASTAFADDSGEIIRTLRAQLEAEKQGAGKMREALAPFAAMARGKDDWGDERGCAEFPLMRDVRAARQALSSDAGRDYAERLRKAEEELEQYKRDAERYRWLRERDVDTIHKGGVFAGVTPENLVINQEDLDAHIDRAMLNAVPEG